MLPRYLPFFIVCLVTLGLSGCDLDWQERADRACRSGQTLEEAGRAAQAAVAYRNALKLNPYHVAANRRLGLLYANYLFLQQHGDAQSVHYLRRYLDLRPADKDLTQKATFLISQLSAIQAGAVENPVDAAQDIVLCMRKQTLPTFVARLHPAFFPKLRLLGVTPAQFLSAWSERLEGCRIRPHARRIYRSRKMPCAVVRLLLHLSSGKQRYCLIYFIQAKEGYWEMSDIGTEAVTGDT